MTLGRNKEGETNSTPGRGKKKGLAGIERQTRKRVQTMTSRLRGQGKNQHKKVAKPGEETWARPAISHGSV